MVSSAGLGAHVAFLALDDVTSLRIADEQLGEHAGETLHRVIGSNGADLEAGSRRRRFGRRSDHAHDRRRARADRLDPCLDRRSRRERDRISAEGAWPARRCSASATGWSTRCTRRRHIRDRVDRRRPCRPRDRPGRRGPTTGPAGKASTSAVACCTLGTRSTGRPDRSASTVAVAVPTAARRIDESRTASATRSAPWRDVTTTQSNVSIRSSASASAAPPSGASAISMSGTCTTSAPSSHEQRIERAGLVAGRDDRPAAQWQLGRRRHHAPDTTSWASRAARRAISMSGPVSPVSSIVSDTMMLDTSLARNVCSLSAST